MDYRDDAPVSGAHEVILDTSSPPSDLDGLRALDGVAVDALQVLCRALRVEQADLEGTLDAVVRSATAAVPAAEHAGLNLLVRGHFEPQATVGEAPPPLDALQQRTGSGPCIDASRDQVTIQIGDMRTEGRWANFARAAVDLGVHAMLCVPLWVDDRRMGSLSLYASVAEAFDGGAARLAELYATHAALALFEAQRVDQMQRAIESRDIIGQAKGVLMCRLQITAEQAFDVLKRASQTRNRRLVDVAELVAATGEVSAS